MRSKRSIRADRQKKWAGAGPISRKQAATDAGLSERPRKTAPRVANVPAWKSNPGIAAR
jgi:hypothetical protein